MLKTLTDKFANPHVLVITSLSLLYIQLFIPSLTVVYQPLLDSNSDGTKIATNITRKAHLFPGEEIHGLDEECRFSYVVWSSKFMEYSFQIWKFAARLIIFLPAMLWFGPYLKAYPVPIPLYVAIILVLAFAPIIYIFFFGDISSPQFCDPVPNYYIKYILPFWSSFLMWLGSMGTAIILVRQINQAKRVDSSATG